MFVTRGNIGQGSCMAYLFETCRNWFNQVHHVFPSVYRSIFCQTGYDLKTLPRKSGLISKACLSLLLGEVKNSTISFETCRNSCQKTDNLELYKTAAFQVKLSTNLGTTIGKVYAQTYDDKVDFILFLRKSQKDQQSGKSDQSCAYY